MRPAYVPEHSSVIVAFSCYLWLLRVARTSLVSTYAYVNPIVAVVLGALVLHEGVSARLAVAGMVSVAGVALIVVNRVSAHARGVRGGFGLTG